MIGQMIGEMGVRFRPSSKADLITHGEALRLLTEDVADVPVAALEVACKTWIRSKPFLPKAAELIALADAAVRNRNKGSDAGAQHLEDHCARLNALKGDKRWFVVGTAPHRTITNEPRQPDLQA